MIDQAEAWRILLAAAAGFTLAACCGLRTFLPALAVAVAGRLGWLTPPEELAWIVSTPALVALAVAVVLEIAADKVPVLDHALDVAGVALRPAAGALVAVLPVVSVTGWVGQDQRTLLVGASMAAGGGALGLAIHLMRAKLRLGSTLLTGGLANPLLSVIDDVLALLGSIVALLAPLLGLALLAGGIVLLWRALARAFPAPPDQAGSMR